MKLAGKKAFVTGGSRGMGAAIVRRLAADGADVAFTYNSSPGPAEALRDSVEASGRRALAVRANSIVPSEIEAAISEAADALGGIDILVNNAGIFKVMPIDEMSLEVFNETVTVHLTAAFVATKSVINHMPEGGRIISIGSNLAFRASFPGLTAYSASKAAISGFTHALARDLGPRGITAVAIHPGSTDTDMNPANGPAADGQRAATATGRYGTPDEVADLVAFLAGPTGRSVTGADWLLDNGANA